jgi:cell division protein FtsQ
MPGVDVMLPDDNIEVALNTLLDLDRQRDLLANDIAAVDLRLADRVSVRLQDGSEVPPSGTLAPVVPTASVKSKT